MLESITLARWAKHAGVRDIDIMWIDLQGAEHRAFKGMENLISRVKAIYTEVEFKEMY
jgi:FkbM family methyltransferase